MYNRSPIDFKGRRQIVLDGVQKDRRNVISLGFQAYLFGNNATLDFITQVIRSNSNSRAFNYSGNRTKIWLAFIPTSKLRAWFRYQIVAYDLGAYQTSDMGYEMSEHRTDDQSYVRFGATYDISQQVSIQLFYEHIENSSFFTGEFYKKNTFGTGLVIKF
jgi:hypothetical protein